MLARVTSYDLFSDSPASPNPTLKQLAHLLLRDEEVPDLVQASRAAGHVGGVCIAKRVSLRAQGGQQAWRL